MGKAEGIEFDADTALGWADIPHHHEELLGGRCILAVGPYADICQDRSVLGLAQIRRTGK